MPSASSSSGIAVGEVQTIAQLEQLLFGHLLDLVRGVAALEALRRVSNP